MNRTGVFATTDEIASVKAAATTPMIALNVRSPQDPLKLSHSYALEHGLPEVSGYYGMDLTTGEFVSA